MLCCATCSAVHFCQASGNPPVFPGLPASPVNATCATVGQPRDSTLRCAARWASHPHLHTLRPAGPAATDDALLAALATVTGWFYGLAPGGCLKDAASDQVGGGTPGDGPSPADSWGHTPRDSTPRRLSLLACLLLASASC